MTFTVASLLALPELQTVSLTPGVGLDRQITWAHVCELPDPWSWLGQGALVMTTGLAFPAGPDEQCSYFDGLHRAGISAVTFDEQMPAHPLTDEAIEHAKQIGFPILRTAHEVRFVSIAMVVAEALQRQHNTRLREAEQLYGSLLLSELCDGSVPSAPATRLVSTYDLTPPYLLAAASPDEPHLAFDETYAAFNRAGLPVLAAIKDDQLLILIESAGAERVLGTLSGRCGSFGVSAPLYRVDELPSAMRQARSVLIRNHQPGSVLRFDEHEPGSLFLPNDPEQLRGIARQVLGPLRTYDEQRGTSLTHTLTVFLEENRSWIRAAERLFVHRQTLIARVSRIEKIINRDLSSMEDTAECWLAIQAAISCGDLDPTPR